MNQAMVWFNKNKGKLESSQRAIIQKKCSEMSDDKGMMLNQVSLKSPFLAFVVSLLLGEFGVDRLLLGEIGMAVLKFLTFGVFGILYLIDVFTIMGRVKKINTQRIMPYL
ncbi:MAG: TM2 domain-containing protein [Kiritimatiellae bacterium]|nr:TM2 domain-containing protein [Kiritimatiellia bacterium]